MSRDEPLLPPGIPTVITMGTFDGLHLGHRAVLDEIRKRAEARGGRSVLVTFDPHPLAVVRPADAPPLLTPPEEKKELLAESGIDCVVFLAFTQELARLSPEEFVERILLRRFRAAEIVIGYDHGFGRDRSGGADTLRDAGRALGFAVDVVPPVLEGGGAISSSRIRSAIAEGDLVTAESGLGRRYSLRGRVVPGERKGRELGFPTANLALEHPEKLVPAEGIYAGWVAGRHGILPAAVHIGPRPVFGGYPSSIEAHILGFEGDLYGETVRIDFVRSIRPVLDFPSVEALVARMEVDVAEVGRILEKDRAGGAASLDR